jgi:hypothetical protein
MTTDILRHYDYRQSRFSKQTGNHHNELVLDRTIFRFLFFARPNTPLVVLMQDYQSSPSIKALKS